MAGSRSLGQLTLDLIAKIGGFTAPLDQAGRALDKRTREMEKRSQAFAKSMTGAFSGLALKLGTFVGGFFAVNKAVDGFFSSIDRADHMRDLSIQLGIGVEKLSALAYAASQTGVELEDFATSLKFLEKNAAAALDPKSNQRGLFDAILGKGKADLANTEHLLLQLSDAFKAMGDSPHQAALELELFGKSGIKMAEFLKQGSAGVKTLTDRARELGVVISQEAADGADQFNDKLGDLKSVAAGLGTQLATALMPQVEALLDWAIKFGSDPGNVKKLVEDTTAAMNNFATAIGQVATVGGNLFAILDTIHEKFSASEKAVQSFQLTLAKGVFPAGSDVGDFFRENERRLGLAPPDFSNVKGHVGPDFSNVKGSSSSVDSSDTKAQQDRLNKYLGGNTDATNKNSDAKRKAAEAARAQAEREREVEEAIKKADDATKAFTVQLEDLVAHQGGKLAESQLDYARRQKELEDLQKAGEISTTDLAKAIGLLHQERDADAESIRAQLDTGGERLKQMQNELDLLNLQTQAERDRAAFKLDNPTATDAQADGAARIQAQIDQTQKAIQATDDMRQSFEEAFINLPQDGIGAIKAFGDAFVAQLIRMAAQAASLKLFGEPGTTGGGWLGSLTSALFGGGSGASSADDIGALIPGFARGTDFAPGGMAWVGEHGRELVNLPRGAQVIPNHEVRSAAGAGVALTQNFYQPLNERTADQAAKRGATAQQRAMTRNGR